MTEHEGEIIAVKSRTARAIVTILEYNTKGPGEAYATLILALRMLHDMNVEETGNTLTDDEIIAEFAKSWRSIEEIRDAPTH